MKKILFVFLIFTSLISFSQSLPNNDMEEWENFLIYEEPENWNSPNPFTALLGEFAVSKSNDAQSGNHSAKLTTLSILDGQLVIPGLLTLADFSINIFDSSYSISGGYYLQENVHKVTGWYKYSGVEGDSASLFMYNFKNSVATGFDTIGAGYAFLTDADDWKPFTILMQNFNSSIPDTFNIIISSSSLLSAKEGSSLLIDNLLLHTNTGIIDLWNNTKPLKVFPNPATDNINFKTNIFENGSVLTIYDNFGKEIVNKEFENIQTKIDVSGFTPGVYVYKLTLNNRLLNSGTFIKTK
jgi:hypothetical protein